MPKPMLNKQELESTAWNKVEEYAKDWLNTYRKKNDYILTPDETNRLRGRIEFCKMILELNPENEDI